MKKIISVFASLLVLICFFSCSNPSSIQTEDTSYRVQLYKVESGVITKSTYNTAWNKISKWTNLSYSNCASLRKYLLDNTISDYTNVNDVTINEIKRELKSHGMSNREVEDEIKVIEEIGNEIIFFNIIYGDDKKGWVYITE